MERGAATGVRLAVFTVLSAATLPWVSTLEPVRIVLWSAHVLGFAALLLTCRENLRSLRHSPPALAGLCVALMLTALPLLYDSGSPIIHSLGGGALVWALTRAAFPSSRRWVTGLGLGLVLVVLPVGARRGGGTDLPDQVGSQPRNLPYTFLTATAAGNSGVGGFPSALANAATDVGCTAAGCHQGLNTGLHAAHVAAGEGRFWAEAAGFAERKGPAAASWCAGCHTGGVTAPSARGISCSACHTAAAPSGMFGSACLSPRRTRPGWQVLTRLSTATGRLAHEQEMRATPLKTGVACAACHRKHYGLPQTKSVWLRGPDEYRPWLASGYSGQSLLSPSQPRRDCISCHSFTR